MGDSLHIWPARINSTSARMKLVHIPQISIFIASPGDVQREHHIADELVQDIAIRNELKNRVALEVVMENGDFPGGTLLAGIMALNYVWENGWAQSDLRQKRNARLAQQ